MINYECEGCKKTVEIEKYEAECGHHEHYEQGLCIACFKSITTAISSDKLIEGKRYYFHDDMVSYVGKNEGDSMVVEQSESFYMHYSNPDHLIGTPLPITDEFTFFLYPYQGEFNKGGGSLI